MSGHFGLHTLLAGLVTALAVSGCASTSPQVKVLGVEQAHAAPRQALLVFVEVVNPTSRDLRLSRMEYRVQADSWFESAGQVKLSREIGAGSSAVVEIPVPVDHPAATRDRAVPYTLEGKLFAREDRIERSWKVAARGALGRASESSTDAGDPVRVTVVAADR